MTFFQVMLIVMCSIVSSFGVTHLYRFFIVYKRTHYKYLYLAFTAIGIAGFIFAQLILSTPLSDSDILLFHRIKIGAVIILVMSYLTTISVIAEEKKTTAFRYLFLFFVPSLCVLPFDFFLSYPVRRMTTLTPLGPFNYAIAQTNTGYTVFSILLVGIFFIATFLVARSKIIRSKKFYAVLMMLPIVFAVNDFLVIHGVFHHLLLSEYYFAILLFIVSFVFLREENENQKRLENINAELESRIRERTKELEAANAKLLELATTDALTGLDNREKLLTRLHEERSRFERYHKNERKSFSVVFLDLDNFKQCNDTLGHGAGDFILRQFAEMLRSSVRASDIVARFGGDEFIVILPETEIAGAIDFANRIHEKITACGHFQAELEIFLAKGMSAVPQPKIDCSIGIAMYDSFMEIDTLLTNADKALYAAKAKGKHCFAVWEKGVII
jgi:diguanylate cyclase (GGDEF)-like protein